MRKLISAVYCAIPAAILLNGCGGGGDSGTAATAPAPTANVNVTINWAARTRDVDAPASALSAVFTLKLADPSGSDFTFTIERESTPAAYKKSYSSLRLAKLGTWDLAASFYAQPGGQGSVVGKIDAQINLTADGKGIGDFATGGTVASVAVVPNQTVPLGVPTDIAFTARDSGGADLALTPGSARFQVVTGTNFLTINTKGQAVGSSPGISTVNVTVDGKTSPDQTVSVGSVPVISVSPASVQTVINNQVVFNASIAGSPEDSLSNWSVQEANGGAVDSSGRYIAPTVAGTFHVIASSHLDTSKRAVATVTVTSPSNIDATGVFIPDGYSRIVRLSDMTGSAWNAFAGPAGGPGIRPSSVFVAADGKIYFTEDAKHRIVRIDDMTGKNMVAFGTQGSGAGQFDIPSGISVTPTGEIYVADPGNKRLVRISDMAGAGWTTYGTGILSTPYRVFTPADGRIYIVEQGGRVVRVDNMSGAGFKALGFSGGGDAAVSVGGQIYMVNGNTISRVDDISSTTGESASFGFGSGIRQFAGIRSVSVGRDGRLYLWDGGGRLVRIDDLSGTNWVSFKGNDSGLGTLGAVSAVAVP